MGAAALDGTAAGAVCDAGEVAALEGGRTADVRGRARREVQVALAFPYAPMPRRAVRTRDRPGPPASRVPKCADPRSLMHAIV